MEEAVERPETKRERFVWFIVIVSSLSGVLYGYMVGMIAGVQLPIGEHFNETTVVHGLRLNLIEFFNWSVTGEGYPFRAFRKRSRDE